MGHVAVLEAPQHVGNCICLANVGEKLIPQTFAFRRAFDEAGDVDECHTRRDNLL